MGTFLTRLDIENVGSHGFCRLGVYYTVPGSLNPKTEVKDDPREHEPHQGDFLPYDPV